MSVILISANVQSEVLAKVADLEDVGVVKKVLELLIVHFICPLNCCCSHPLLLYSTIRVI